MRNAMAILLLAAGIAPLAGVEASKTQTSPDQYALAPVPENPVMQLPGMRPLPRTVFPETESLPRPLISDVTNYPNPFDSRKGGLEGQTQISYHLNQNAPVTVTLFDLLGFRVRRWQFSAGENGGREGVNTFAWDGTNETGRKVSKGGYLAQIEVDLPGAAVTVIRKIGVIH